MVAGVPKKAEAEMGGVIGPKEAEAIMEATRSVRELQSKIRDAIDLILSSRLRGGNSDGSLSAIALLNVAAGWAARVRLPKDVVLDQIELLYDQEAIKIARSKSCTVHIHGDE